MLVENNFMSEQYFNFRSKILDDHPIILTLFFPDHVLDCLRLVVLDLRVRHEVVEGDDERLLAPFLHLERGQPQVRVAPVKEPTAESCVE